MSIERMEEPEDMSRPSRIRLWIIAWLVAGLTTVIPDPFSTIFAWAFPLGLFAIIFPHERDFGFEFLLGGWFFYGFLTVVGLAQKRSARFFLFYAILCVLLVLNVVGCHVIWKQPIQDSL